MYQVSLRHLNFVIFRKQYPVDTKEIDVNLKLFLAYGGIVF